MVGRELGLMVRCRPSYRAFVGPSTVSIARAVCHEEFHRGHCPICGLTSPQQTCTQKQERHGLSGSFQGCAVA